MRISGDIVLVSGLFAVLIGVIVFVLPYLRSEDSPNEIPYSTYSRRPDGTRALYILLDKLGYRVTRIQDADYMLNDIEVFFLLQPLSLNELSWNIAMELE